MAQFMLNPLTLSNINRFSKFFHCQNEEKLCNNIITKDPTTPQVCRYTMLWNVSVLKATIENTATSVTTSSSSSREARLTVNITVNMFSASVYYLTSVQDASATPGPCSKTAHHHPLLGTHWRTCGVRTSCSSSLSALEVFFTRMRYINLHLTLTCGPQTARTSDNNWDTVTRCFQSLLSQNVLLQKSSRFQLL